MTGPTLAELLSLHSYNTRVVLTGTALLGLASGVVGTFLLLRRRALLSDALSHATLPGVVLAFLLLAALGGDARALPLLLLGAAVTGVLGMLAVTLLGRYTRLKEDTALAIVLSTFFGFGIALLSIAQQVTNVSAAGLNDFIYGKAASMLLADAWLIAGAAALTLICVSLLFKEFRLLCFDSGYTGAVGFPVLGLDLLLMALVVLVTVIGLQTVGLILIVSLLIIPPAAARFWTDRLPVMTIAGGAIGMASTVTGSLFSATFERLPGGAMIVLAAAVLFLVSFFFGTRRGLMMKLHRQWASARQVTLQNLLRDAWEWRETSGNAAFTLGQLHPYRSLSRVKLARAARRARRRGLIREESSGSYTFTREGERLAARMVRSHRLWELYLITHADIAPSHVDRDADAIEHILDPALLDRLEGVLREAARLPEIPSPHRLATEGEGGPKEEER